VRGERLAGLLGRLSPAERAALTAALPAIDALTLLEPESGTRRPSPDRELSGTEQLLE
jgi:hypothetical protein